MPRTRGPFRKADAILCDDIHLREDQPSCRTDDFWTAQWKKIDFIADLQRKHQCVVLHAGDLGNHWRWSPHLLSTAMEHLPEQFYTVFGQHDLPYHNLDLFHKSGVFTLATCESLVIGPGCSFGQSPENYGHTPAVNTKALIWNDCHMKIKGRKVLIWHILNWTKKPPWPGCTDPTSEELLDKYPYYDLIVTGDHHKSFVVKKDGRLLVNGGNLSRQTADQWDYQPAVYLWYAEDNSVKRVEIPIAKGVISREHLSGKNDRDARIEAFISSLSNDYEAGVSFDDNLKRFFQENKVRESVKKIIVRAVEEMGIGEL